MSVVGEWSGRRIGKYLLTAPLGRGGMGAVYAGTDLHLRRSVAVKLIPADPDSFSRFLREARAAARVSHPNVVATFDVGREKDVFYLVMELVRGDTAQALVARRGPLPWAEATTLLAAACRGLYAAHKAGLIHRDVKPANILCPTDGEPKLADFGLARPVLTRTHLTHANTLVGTPEYMSPEQCRGEPLDARTDVYSLGATYHFLLTGRTPYASDDRAFVLFAHCTHPVPDLRAAHPSVPPACAAVIARAMAKQRRDRYPDCRAMADALAAVLDGTGIELPALTDAVVAPAESPLDGPATEPLGPPRRPPTRPRARLRWVWALPVVTVVTLSVAWFGVRSKADPDPSPTEARPPIAAAPPNGRPSPEAFARVWGLPAEAGRVVWPAPEPYWFATTGTGRASAFTLWDANRRGKIVPTSTPVTAMAVEPAGRWFAVATADHRVALLAAADLTPLGTLELTAPAVALAGHGTRLAVATAAEVLLFDVSAPATPVAVALAGTACPSAVQLTFNTDGSLLAALLAGSTLQVWDTAAARERTRATFGGTVATAVAFGEQPGQLLYVGRKDGRSANFAWDRVGREAPHAVAGPPNVTAVGTARSRRLLLVGGGGWLGLQNAFDKPVGVRPLSNALPTASPLRTVVAVPTGRHYVCGYEDGSIELWAPRPDGP